MRARTRRCGWSSGQQDAIRIRAEAAHAAIRIGVDGRTATDRAKRVSEHLWNRDAPRVDLGARETAPSGPPRAIHCHARQAADSTTLAQTGQRAARAATRCGRRTTVQRNPERYARLPAMDTEVGTQVYRIARIRLADLARLFDAVAGRLTRAPPRRLGKVGQPRWHVVLLPRLQRRAARASIVPALRVRRLHRSRPAAAQQVRVSDDVRWAACVGESHRDTAEAIVPLAARLGELLRCRRTSRQTIGVHGRVSKAACFARKVFQESCDDRGPRTGPRNQGLTRKSSATRQPSLHRRQAPTSG